MSKRSIWTISLVCCAVMMGMMAAGSALAAGDADAVKAMSKAERQAFKAQMEAAIRGNGVPAKGRAFAPAGREAGPPPKALGSITYHSGALGSCCNDSYTVGNQFDTALNTAGTNVEPIEMSGSITMATFDMISVGGTGAFISIYDQLVGGTANGVTSISTAGVVPGLNTKTIGPVAYVGDTFLAGIWQIGTSPPTGDIPAVATGTVGGQGYHGMQINDIVATDFGTIGSLNAAFTATGDVLTPVELLNFDVE